MVQSNHPFTVRQWGSACGANQAVEAWILILAFMLRYPGQVTVVPSMARSPWADGDSHPKWMMVSFTWSDSVSFTWIHMSLW